MPKTFLVFFGSPGSGKGTQAELLAPKINLPIVSTGQIFRAAKEENTPMGEQIRSILASGQLVPDEIVEKILDRELEGENAQNGIILDGYPRTIKQSEHLNRKFSEITDKNDKVYGVLIKVSDAEVEHRLSSRRMCECGAAYHLMYKPPTQDDLCDICGGGLYIRDDDKPEVVKERLNLYHEKIDEVLKSWEDQGRMILVNGEQSIDEVQIELLEKLKEKGILG